MHADVNTRKGANGELFLDNSIPQNSDLSTASGEKASGKSKLGSAEFDHRFMSPDLWGQDEQIERDLEKISAGLKTRAKVFSGEMSETGRQNLRKTKKALNALSEAGGNEISLVVTERSDEYNGVLVDGHTIYIAEDQLESDGWAGTLVHEFTHFEEGTAEYSEMMERLLADDILVDDGQGGRDTLRAVAEAAVQAKGYGFDVEALRTIVDKADAGERLTEEEGKALRAYISEVTAHETEILLGNEVFIDRIVRQNGTLAERLVGKILSLDKVFSKMGDAQTKAQLGKLREAERLYLRAAEAAGNGSIKKMILAQVPELEDEETATGVDEARDPSREVRYSLKVREVNGKTHIANPYTTSREDVVDYLVKARKRVLDKYTYFPIDAHTPSALISSLKNAGILVEDKPMAMQADKARQAQLDGEKKLKDGTIIRRHHMSVEEILEVIEKMDDPQIIIQQKDRVKAIEEDGETVYVPLPDSFTVFVTLDNGKECVAVVEFDSEIKEHNIVKDGQGESYHTTVTIFEPDVERDGEPFDYAEYLLSKDSNEELEIKKESPTSEPAITGIPSTDSEKGLSDNSIAQNSDLSTENAKKVSDDGGKVQFSRKDSRGHALTEAQAEFKDFYRSGEVRDPSSEVYFSRKGVDGEQKDGYNKNAKQNSERGDVRDGREEDNGRTDPTNARGNEGALSEEGRGRRVSQDIGTTEGTHRKEVWTIDGGSYRRGALTSKKTLYPSEDMIEPAQGTSLYGLKQKFQDEYGIICHIVREKAWKQDSAACAYKGQVYVVESMENDFLDDIIPHEATHVMWQVSFEPYIEFIKQIIERKKARQFAIFRPKRSELRFMFILEKSWSAFTVTSITWWPMELL